MKVEILDVMTIVGGHQRFGYDFGIGSENAPNICRSELAQPVACMLFRERALIAHAPLFNPRYSSRHVRDRSLTSLMRRLDE